MARKWVGDESGWRGRYWRERLTAKTVRSQYICRKGAFMNQERSGGTHLREEGKAGRRRSKELNQRKDKQLTHACIPALKGN